MQNLHVDLQDAFHYKCPFRFIKVKKQRKPVNIHVLMNDFCLVVFELKIYANNTAFDPHGLSCVGVD